MILTPLILLSFFYVVYILVLYKGTQKVCNIKVKELAESEYKFVSIIIPFYNEDTNLESCLKSINKLEYPKEKFEVVLVNDGSTDNSLSVINNVKKNLELDIRILDSSIDKKNSGKNAALQVALDNAKGEIIFSTDSDCEVGSKWLIKMLPIFTENVGAVCGPVLYNKKTEKNLFMKIQSLDFASMSIIATGYNGIGKSMNANANNLAYRKEAVQDIGGFKALPAEKITIADDDVLVQMISASKKWIVKSTLDKDAVNFSDPAWTYKEFILRRMRWSTSTKYFVSKLSLLPLVLVLFFYVSLLVVPFIAIFTNLSIFVALGMWASKAFVDFFILSYGTSKLNKKYLMKYFLFAQPFQVFYIVISVFLGRVFIKE